VTSGEWTYRPITGTFGIELSGAYLVDGFDPAWLTSLIEQHLVVVLRGQHLSPAEQVSLASALGQPTPAHPVVPGHPDHPEILELDAALGGRNARWHTDVTFMPTPPSASILVAEDVPPSGGDTLWADLRSGYHRLSRPIRDLIDDLQAVHRISPLAYWGEPFDSALTRGDAIELYEQAARVPPVIHPVVRVHPTTGLRALFVNPGFTSHVVGLSRIESEAVLEMLYAHMVQPELVLRHRWCSGDVVIWDNRATMHYATDDYGAAKRRMRRVTLRGVLPAGPSGFESFVPDDPLVTIR
jgi:alpha-ketoglutarate-dependent taurine dioxygenase